MFRRFSGATLCALTALVLVTFGAAAPAAAGPPFVPPGHGGTPSGQDGQPAGGPANVPPGHGGTPPGQGDPPAPGGDPEPSPGEEPPGNRGTVKIHEVGTPDDDRRNEPHVCEFRIVGFGFPADADLLVEIAGHGRPNAGAGTFTADLGAGAVNANGDFAIAGPTLPDGMYRLTVENRTAPGGAKQKVFHVDCPDSAGATTTTTGPTTTTTSTTLAGGTIDDTIGGTIEGRRVTLEAASGSRATATEVLGESVTRPAPRGARALALSGADVAAMVIAGLGLLLGGTALRRRRIRPGW